MPSLRRAPSHSCLLPRNRGIQVSNQCGTLDSGMEGQRNNILQRAIMLYVGQVRNIAKVARGETAVATDCPSSAVYFPLLLCCLLRHFLERWLLPPMRNSRMYPLQRQMQRDLGKAGVSRVCEKAGGR